MTPADLAPQLYDELRKLAAAKMAGEPVGHTLDATGLVNEAWLRLKADTFATRSDFLRAAAVAMRRILVDHARTKNAAKRTAGRRADVDLNLVPDADGGVDLEALDEALDRLAAVQPQVAELVQLRYFSGLTIPEAADALGIAPRTADAWWASHTRADRLQRGRRPRAGRLLRHRRRQLPGRPGGRGRPQRGRRRRPGGGGQAKVTSYLCIDILRAGQPPAYQEYDALADALGGVYVE